MSDSDINPFSSSLSGRGGHTSCRVLTALPLVAMLCLACDPLTLRDAILSCLLFVKIPFVSFDVARLEEGDW